MFLHLLLLILNSCIKTAPRFKGLEDELLKDTGIYERGVDSSRQDWMFDVVSEWLSDELLWPHNLFYSTVSCDLLICTELFFKIIINHVV